MTFIYQRTVRFEDTDAAGVVYFANVLKICHEAYEEVLIAAGIDLKSFFRDSDVAVPIVHADVDFFRPLHCGDRLSVQVNPHPINDSEFEIIYEIGLADFDRPASRASTRHVCIDPVHRSRKELPSKLRQWIQH